MQRYVFQIQLTEDLHDDSIRSSQNAFQADCFLIVWRVVKHIHMIYSHKIPLFIKFLKT